VEKKILEDKKAELRNKERELQVRRWLLQAVPLSCWPIEAIEAIHLLVKNVANDPSTCMVN